MADLAKIVEELSKLTVLEAAELSKLLEEEWGVSAAVAVAASGGGDAGEDAGVKDNFNVTLKEIGGNKIAVIKEVRAITGLGLKEAKEMVDSAPSVLKEGVGTSEAEEMKAKLEAAGATVELA